MQRKILETRTGVLGSRNERTSIPFALNNHAEKDTRNENWSTWSCNERTSIPCALNNHAKKDTRNENWSTWKHLRIGQIEKKLFVMEFKRNSVIALYLAGKSQSAIVRELEHIKVNRKFVYRTINRYNETGSVVKRYGGGPKKTATSPEMVRKVKKRLERNPRRSGNQMAKELNISQSSIRRILQNELQVKAYKKQKAHDLTPNQKKVRFERAKELLRLAASGEFPNIVFSDEKNFPIEQFVNTQNDRVYLTERTYENLKHRLVTRSNYPSQIMVWAAVTATGRSPLVFIEPGVKTQILWTIPSGPSSRAKCAQKKHASMDALKQSLKREWAKIPLEHIRAACESFPGRLKAIIHAKGGHIEPKFSSDDCAKDKIYDPDDDVLEPGLDTSSDNDISLSVLKETKKRNSAKQETVVVSKRRKVAQEKKEMKEQFREIPDKVNVSRRIYETEFHKLQLAFKKPKVDTCHKCDVLNMKLKVAKEAEKEVVQNKIGRHQAEANNAYIKKDADKKLAKGNNIINCCTCDGQNKNSHVAAMFPTAMQRNVSLEKKQNKLSIEISHPHDWYHPARSVGKKQKFLVKGLTYDMLLNFADLYKIELVLRQKDSMGNLFKWHDAQ
ncbi:hypothetical protein ILUMI_07635 [Ignelater luminosus]|uniref:Transposase n=1 Tax=Ignelater luminosus TaxID=2038154 RepID=A0A8K0D3H9_IGNLU|nr:hypothetical protein ILUMI_07635 [Ignelater luminosus]